MDEGSISKLLNPIEKHSSLIGAGLAALYEYKNGTITDLMDRFLSGQVHFPDLKEMQGLIGDPAFMGPAVIGIAGYFLKDATSNATLKKVAGIAQGGGLGYAAVIATAYLLSSMVHSDSGPSGNAASSDLSGSRGYS